MRTSVFAAGKSIRKGPWTVVEDRRLTEYVQSHETISWLSVPVEAGLSRSSKSCRLRWINYLNRSVESSLRNFTDEEKEAITLLHCQFGNRWSAIATRLPGRTADEVKTYWKSHIKNFNPLTNRPMSTGSLYSSESIGKKKGKTKMKNSDVSTSNDEQFSDVSDIISELSSNAGDLWSDELSLEEPYVDFGVNLGLDLDHLDYPDDLLSHYLSENFDLPKTTDSVSTQNDASFWMNVMQLYTNQDMNDTGVGQNGNNVVLQVDYSGSVSTQNEINDVNDVGQNNIDYSDISDATLNDTDADDEQNNVDYLTSKICISLEVLKERFCMNMEDAAKSLDVSRSTLKRICRKYGIKRWPNSRKRRKINNHRHANPKNLNKVVRESSPPKESRIASALGDGSSSSSSSVTIKATYEGDILKFPLSRTSGVDDLREKVGKRLNLEVTGFKLKYKDDDGDLVLIACDEDLQDCLGSSRLTRQVGNNTTFDIFVFQQNDQK